MISINTKLLRNDSKSTAMHSNRVQDTMTIYSRNSLCALNLIN